MGNTIKKIITVEENVLAGGFGESVEDLLCNTEAVVRAVGLPNEFIEHGDVQVLRRKYGLTAENIADIAVQMIG
jgi:1-deoxy-D-xylulose-5-phosphate synthase